MRPVDGADLVPGPPDALQPAGHRRRRLDLDHQVDGAHVDAQLQAGGGDQGRQPPGLERLLDLGPLLLGHRAVVGPHQLGGRPARRSRPAPSCCGGRVGPRRHGSSGRPARRRSSFSRAASRSASRRELTNTIVERWASISSSTRGSTCGQIDAPVWARRRSPPDRSPVGVPSSAMSSTGTTICELDGLAVRRLRRRVGRPAPPRNGGHLVSGRRVADSPIRCGGPLQRARRAAPGDSARCAPRLVAGDRVDLVDDHVSTPRSASRACEVSSRNSDSGVVIRMSGGLGREPAALLGRGVAGRGCRPRRRARAGRAAARPAGCPASGARRLRSTSTASALSGETYRTRQRRLGIGRRRREGRAGPAPRGSGQGLARPVGARIGCGRPGRSPPSARLGGGGRGERPGEPRPGGAEKRSSGLMLP